MIPLEVSSWFLLDFYREYSWYFLRDCSLNFFRVFSWAFPRRAEGVPIWVPRTILCGIPPILRLPGNSTAISPYDLRLIKQLIPRLLMEYFPGLHSEFRQDSSRNSIWDSSKSSFWYFSRYFSFWDSSKKSFRHTEKLVIERHRMLVVDKLKDEIVKKKSRSYGIRTHDSELARPAL